MPKLFNTKEASEITGYSIDALRRFVREGKLRALRISPCAEMRFKEVWLMNLTHAPKTYKYSK